MRSAKIPILFVALLMVTSSLVAIKANQQPNSFDYLSGEDCNIEHGSFVLHAFSLTDESSTFIVGTPFLVNLSFIPTTPDIYYSVIATMDSQSGNVSLLSNSLQQISATSEVQTVSWELNSSETGSFGLEIDVVITIGVPLDYPVHPGYEADYSGTFAGSIDILPIGSSLPEPEDLNDAVNPFDVINAVIENLLGSISLQMIGGILGLIGTGLLIITSILGQKEFQFLLLKQKSMKSIRRSTLCRWHCWLSGLSFILIGLHFVALAFSAFWRYVFTWWEFFPQFLIPASLTDLLTFRELMYSIELGRIGLTLMILVGLGGLFFKPLTRRIGYKNALRTQEISYIILPLMVIHARTLGTYTRNIDALFWFFLLGTILVLVTKLGFYLQKKILERKKQHDSDESKTTIQSVIEI